MGKIRVKAFGDEELEQKQKEEEQKRKEAKIAAAKGEAVAEPKEEVEVEQAERSEIPEGNGVSEGTEEKIEAEKSVASNAIDKGGEN